MRDFVIITETTTDLPASYIEENGLVIAPLYYQIEETVYGEEKHLEPKEFFDAMRNGATPTTSASNPDTVRRKYIEIIESGKDILHLAFSSGLSCSYNNAAFVANEVSEEYPDAKISVVDTLCASLGQGLIVNSAVQMKKQGKSIDEIAAWVESNKLNLCHQFTVDDLIYLYRGGRLNKSSAILGTIINIKPVLHVDNEGHLVPLSKVRGRKKSLNALVDNMVAALEGYEYDLDNEWVYISHGDCLEDAEYVKAQVEERIGVKNFLINYLSPTIGSHSGPGTVALFHYGKSR